MKPKTLLNAVKPEAVSAPAVEHKELDFDFKTENPLFVTTDEIIKILGISRATFQNWLKNGKFSGVRTLRHQKNEAYKFLKEDFKKWINESMMSI